MSSLEEPIRHRFSSLQGLRSLSLANVDFYDSGLVDVCSLPRLESLDLSNTSVTNLNPLLGLKERLRSLTLHQLKRLEMSTGQLLGVIGQLDVLQVSGRMSMHLTCFYWLIRETLSLWFSPSRDCVLWIILLSLFVWNPAYAAPGHQWRQAVYLWRGSSAARTARDPACSCFPGRVWEETGVCVFAWVFQLDCNR